MILTTFFFYLFAAVMVAAAFMVISSRNPVHSVLFLILTFFNASGLFILIGAEFLAMLLVVVYVGAVAVLFLFVVMMLDVDFVELRQGFLQYLPVGGLVAFVLLAELVLVFGSSVISPDVAGNAVVPIPDAATATNVEAFGQVLYTKYAFFVEVASFVLVVAMIGAIVLTLRHKEGVKRQNVADQVARTPEDAIEIKKVESGKGL
ncbi:NADH-quinone oxidoreductase subunit J [Coralliovum pocilloporae]|uniref:NADH-quinone oxidoreductase subunit J n=1 Tax=Coralliovum pocilloporae TaxID=3066369 RepID=UPI0033071768